MSHSLANILLHIVFSTKNRVDLLTDDIENGAHEVMGNTLLGLNCGAIKIGGVANHVHILCRASRTVTPSKLVERVKVDSSKWIKKQGPLFVDFAWQNGYGVFSISPTHVNKLVEYIENQKAHHEIYEFQYEFRALIEKNGVSCDEKYLWD